VTGWVDCVAAWNRFATADGPWTTIFATWTAIFDDQISNDESLIVIVETAALH
jgi:hypothetical protein